MRLLVGIVLIAVAVYVVFGRSEQLVTPDVGPRSDVQIALRKLSDALKDPEKGRRMQCLGAGPQPAWRSPNAGECEKILGHAIDENFPATTSDQPTKGSPAAREFANLLLVMNEAVTIAFQASICQIRDEEYLNFFRLAQSKSEDSEKKRLNLSAAEIETAYLEANRVFAFMHKNKQNFNLITDCKPLAVSEKLFKLDRMFLEFNSN